MKRILYLLFVLLTVSASTQAQTLTPINPEKMIVRIAEIEVYPEYLTEYLEFANEVVPRIPPKSASWKSMLPKKPTRAISRPATS